jgi:hypothetical protein
VPSKPAIRTPMVWLALRIQMAAVAAVAALELMA